MVDPLSTALFGVVMSSAFSERCNYDPHSLLKVRKDPKWEVEKESTITADALLSQSSFPSSALKPVPSTTHQK